MLPLNIFFTVILYEELANSADTGNSSPVVSSLLQGAQVPSSERDGYCIETLRASPLLTTTGMLCRRGACASLNFVLYELLYETDLHLLPCAPTSVPVCNRQWQRCYEAKRTKDYTHLIVSISV